MSSSYEELWAAGDGKKFGIGKGMEMGDEGRVSVEVCMATTKGLSAEDLALEVSEEDRQRASQIRHKESQIQFLLGRTLVNRCVLRSEKKAIKLDANGKPYVPGGPSFNVSHSGGNVILAYQTNGHPASIGVDMEVQNRSIGMEKIVNRFFSMGEQKVFRELDPEGEAYRVAFFNLWTYKEAVVKAIGLGLRIPLKTLSFSPRGMKEGEEGSRLDWELEEKTAVELKRQSRLGGEVSVHRVALASEGYTIGLALERRQRGDQGSCLGGRKGEAIGVDRIDMNVRWMDGREREANPW